MRKLIECQQKLLKERGLYNGKIDGAWELQSQSAMAGFQQTREFAGLKPRLQNEYFSPFEDLPKGWVWSEDGQTIIDGNANPVAVEERKKKMELEEKELKTKMEVKLKETGEIKSSNLDAPVVEDKKA
jgi:hypothetical protein